MSQYEIAVVVGSLRRDSFNRKLANAIVKLAPSEFSFKQLHISDLPLYNQDDDASQAAPVKRLKDEIAAAQGLLFVTPQYNRSVPGVLKNAIDHASRPYGESAWKGKPAGILRALSGRSARPWPNSTSAIFLPIWMCRRSANPKRLSMQRRDCLTKP
jgi:chromate reductase, NAD(P)H dehydrogenase (quinone)